MVASNIPSDMYGSYRAIATASTDDVLKMIEVVMLENFYCSLDRMQFDIHDAIILSTSTIEERKRFFSSAYTPVKNGTTVIHHMSEFQDIEPEDNPLYFVDESIITQMRQTIHEVSRDIMNIEFQTVLPDNFEQPLTTLEDVFINYVGVMHYVKNPIWIKHQCDHLLGHTTASE